MNKLIHTYRFNYDTTLAATMPFDMVGFSIITPTVQILLPSRVKSQNYQDSVVQTATFPLSLWHNEMTDHEDMALTDNIRVTDELATLGTVAAVSLLIMVYSDKIQLYRNVSGVWTLLGGELALTVAPGLFEERVLPVCLTGGSTWAHEMVMDCRQNGQTAYGHFQRVSLTSIRLPLVMLMGNQSGLLNLSTTPLFNIDEMERFFLTGNLVDDMFPASGTGKYAIFHVFFDGGFSKCIIYYGANYSQSSEVLVFTSVTGRTLPVVEASAYTGTLSFPLTAPGGLAERDQYNMVSRMFYFSTGDAFIDIEFTLTLPVVPTTGNPYMVMSLHALTTATHADYPGLPSEPNALNLVLDFTAQMAYFTSTDNVAINTCNYGCSFDDPTLAGKWRVKIYPIEGGSYVTLSHNGSFVDSMYTTLLEYNTCRIPRQVTWYVNSASGAISANVVVSPTRNKVHFQHEPDMCAAILAAGTLTPCMSNTALEAVITNHGAVYMDTTGTGTIASGLTLTSTKVDSIWTITNSTVLSQITNSNILSSGARSLFLTTRSLITVTSALAVTTATDKVSFKWYYKPMSIQDTNIFVIDAIPTLASTLILGVMIRIIAGKWNVVTSSVSQLAGSPTTLIQFPHTAPAPQANTLYCMGITISPTEIIMYINGVAYPCSSQYLHSNQRLFKSATLPRNRLRIILSGGADSFIDAMMVGWGVTWTGSEMFALNNDTATRSPLVNCDFTKLVTDTGKKALSLPVIASAYGGVVKAIRVTTVYVDSEDVVHIFSLISNYGGCVVDITFTAESAGIVELLYSNDVDNIYDSVSVDLSTTVRGVRLSRGMGLYIKSGIPVTARMVAIYV